MPFLTRSFAGFLPSDKGLFSSRSSLYSRDSSSLFWGTERIPRSKISWNRSVVGTTCNSPDWRTRRNRADICFRETSPPVGKLNSNSLPRRKRNFPVIVPQLLHVWELRLRPSVHTWMFPRVPSLWKEQLFNKFRSEECSTHNGAGGRNLQKTSTSPLHLSKVSPYVRSSRG